MFRRIKLDDPECSYKKAFAEGYRTGVDDNRAAMIDYYKTKIHEKLEAYFSDMRHMVKTTVEPEPEPIHWELKGKSNLICKPPIILRLIVLPAWVKSIEIMTDKSGPFIQIEDED